MHNFSKILKEELVCALGCTEPIAVALAASKAREVLGSEPENIEVKCSGNIIKNVKGVTVPNSNGMKGVEAATALGIVGGNPSKELEVLSDVNEEDIEKAKKLIEDGKVKVTLKEGIENLDIEIHLFDKDKNHVIVEIMNRHNNFVNIEKNGEILVKNQNLVSENNEDLYENLSVKTIYEYATTVNLDEVRDLLENQITLNSAISEEGLTNEWGSSIGSILLSEDDKIRTRAKARAASGSDARMSGCSMPVVINAGSGNQGITCTLPVLEYAKEHGSSKEDTMRALLISNLIALHIKRYIGRLSAFCGVTSAGAAAGGAIAYIETKNLSMVENTVANALMIASGMVCDGAKPSCAAKIATAVDAGITGFQMAKKGKNFVDGDGLKKEDVEDTIKNIGRMAKEGMKATDIEVLNIMIGN